MATKTLEIDTKGSCLLCLSACENDENNPDPVICSTAFKMLLRYLKIDLMKQLDHVVSSSSSFISDPTCSTNVDISVSLCEYCSSLAISFLQLYQGSEKIRMKLDYCVQKFHEVIVEGARDLGRVREYEKKIMCSNSSSSERPMMDVVINASIAEALRNDTLKNCATRLNLTPRILIANKDLGGKSPPGNNISTTITGGGEEEDEIHKDENSSTSNKSEVDEHEPVTCNSHTEAPEAEVHLEEEEDEDIPDDVSILSEDSDCLEICDTPEEPETETINNLSTPASPGKLPEEASAPKVNDVSTQTPKMKKNWPTGNPGMLHVCSHCQKPFRWLGTLNTHLILAHTLLHFSAQLPQGTTEEVLKSAMDAILDEKIPEPNQSIKGTVISRCPFCPAVCHGTGKLRMHVLDMHFDQVVKYCEREIENAEGRSTKKKSAAHKNKCYHCDESFPQSYKLTFHVLTAHKFVHFSHRLPPGTTEEELRSAVDSVLEGRVEVLNAEGATTYECQLCSRYSPDVYMLHVHIMRKHFDHILNLLKRSGVRKTTDVSMYSTAPSIQKKKFGAAKVRRTDSTTTTSSRSTTTESDGGGAETERDNYSSRMDTNHVTLALRTVIQGRATSSTSAILQTSSSSPQVGYEIASFSGNASTPPGIEFDTEMEDSNFNSANVPVPVISNVFQVKDDGIDVIDIADSPPPLLQQDALDHDGSSRQETGDTFNTRTPLHQPWTLNHNHNQQRLSEGGNQSSHQLQISLQQQESHVPTTSTHSYQCIHCHKVMPRNTQRSHMITFHAFIHFSPQLPPGTTEQHLEAAIGSLLKTKVIYPNNESVHGCPVCLERFSEWLKLREHVLDTHFDYVLAEIENLEMLVADVEPQRFDFSGHSSYIAYPEEDPLGGDSYPGGMQQNIMGQRPFQSGSRW